MKQLQEEIDAQESTIRQHNSRQATLGNELKELKSLALERMDKIVCKRARGEEKRERGREEVRVDANKWKNRHNWKWALAITNRRTSSSSQWSSSLPRKSKRYSNRLFPFLLSFSSSYFASPSSPSYFSCCVEYRGSGTLAGGSKGEYRGIHEALGGVEGETCALLQNWKGKERRRANED